MSAEWNGDTAVSQKFFDVAKNVPFALPSQFKLCVNVPDHYQTIKGTLITKNKIFMVYKPCPEHPLSSSI